MKLPIPLIVYILILLSCNNGTNKSIPIQSIQQTSFFPVTSYLKGQIIEIKQKGITPVKYVTVNNHTDSIWLKIEELDKELQEFLTPEIDTANLINYFKETKFFDQTIHTFTFTYDPIQNLPDTLALTHWDVYVDPDKNTIKKIYMIKNYPSKILQLTWYSNKYCQIITIDKNSNGLNRILKEEKIKWDF